MQRHVVVQSSFCEFTVSPTFFKINQKLSKKVKAMETAMELHELLTQCNVLLSQSNSCVCRLDEIIKMLLLKTTAMVSSSFPSSFVASSRSQ